MVNDHSRLPGRRFPVPDSTDVPPALRAEGAFLPDPLPSHVVLRQTTWRDAANAQEALARLDTRMRGMPAAKEWSYQAFRREMRTSAWLDDLMVNSREALLVDERADGGQEAVRLFLGYVQAGVEMVDAARRRRPLTPDLLGRFSVIMFGASMGDGPPWRPGYHWLGGPGVDSAYLIVAPPGPEMFVAAAQLCSWVRAQDELAVVVKIALALAQFLLLSPFPGSAHLARLMISHEFMMAGLLSEPALPISEWLYRDRAKFAALIRGVVDRGDFDSLVVFLSAGIREICRLEQARVDEAWANGTELTRRYNKKTSITILTEALAFRPAMNLRQIAEVCDVSLSQAATLARQLLDDGVVESLDPDAFLGQDDDAAYRRVIFVPRSLRTVLDIYPPL